ncbi:unnamed protein product [Calypogeia fissa]
MVGTWFAAFETSTTTMTWALKYLVDCPDAFKRIQAEQQEILKDKDLSVPGPRLVGEDMKKLELVHLEVLPEVHRTLSITFMISRMAAEDAVYDDFSGTPLPPEQ